MSISATPSTTLTMTPTPSAGQSPCSTNLIGYWKFDEASGTVLTDSGSCGLNGVLNTAARTSSGKINYALNYTTSSSYAYITNSSSLIPTGNTFTISFWINLNTIPSGAYNFLMNHSYSAQPILDVDGLDGFWISKCF